MEVLSLARTSPEFRLRGYPAADIPFIVDETTMTVVSVPTLWLVYIATIPARTRRPNTWLSYARGLLLWLRTCEDNGWDWAVVTEEHLAQWRNHLLDSKSERTKRRYSRNTVIAYLRAVCVFYEWAHERRYIAANPIRVTRRPRSGAERQGLLAHLGQIKDESQQRVILPSEEEQKLPRFYTTEERQKILRLLSPRDRLLVRWALYTGVRIHELAALTLSQIPRVGEYAAGRAHVITLVVSKGGRTRPLFVPSFILDETHHYIRYVRRPTALASRKRATFSNDHALWLGRWGSVLTTGQIRSAFREALDAVPIANGRFHDLRHTYAINMLDQLLAKSPDPRARSREPLKALKRLLGHRSLSSTEIYLRAREEYLDDIVPDDLELPLSEDFDAA